MPKGIVEFYYTQTLPSDAIAIAQITGSDFGPTDLISINNTDVLNQGTLSLWKYSTSLSSPADYIAPDLNVSVAISGDTIYYIGNQFFELTNVVSGDSTPLYYQHVLPLGITNAVILDANNNILSVEMLVQNNTLYHSQPNGYYQVRYVDSSGFVQVEMLLFNPVLSSSIYSPTATQYTYTAKVLSVFNSGTYYIRFLTLNGLQVLTPYTSPSNVPWFPRIRFGVSPAPPEWANQPFLPQRPYLLATWVTGSVLNSSTVQFERRQIYYNPTHLPDILVFSADNKIKYALDGIPVGTVSTKGYEYPWQQGLINEVDCYAGRVSVSVDLDPTDIVFGFYAYQENDILFTEIDVNPFTNPSMKNGQVTFYYKTNGADLTKYLYYQLQNTAGTILQTNDSSHSTGTNQTFALLVAGASVSSADLTITDIRQRGGGLAPAYQNIPEAANFWDLGFWDGKPYPVAGALLIYLPQSVLNNISAAEIQSKLQSILPLGILPVVNYYNINGDVY
jgi:hypothetical protein